MGQWSDLWGEEGGRGGKGELWGTGVRVWVTRVRLWGGKWDYEAME